MLRGQNCQRKQRLWFLDRAPICWCGTSKLRTMRRLMHSLQYSSQTIHQTPHTPRNFWILEVCQHAQHPSTSINIHQHPIWSIPMNSHQNMDNGHFFIDDTGTHQLTALGPPKGAPKGALGPGFWPKPPWSSWNLAWQRRPSFASRITRPWIHGIDPWSWVKHGKFPREFWS